VSSSANSDTPTCATVVWPRTPHSCMRAVDALLPLDGVDALPTGNYCMSVPETVQCAEIG